MEGIIAYLEENPENFLVTPALERDIVVYGQGDPEVMTYSTIHCAIIKLPIIHIRCICFLKYKVITAVELVELVGNSKSYPSNPQVTWFTYKQCKHTFISVFKFAKSR